MKSKGPPEHCKGCRYFWRHGTKDHGYNRWCCYFSKPATKATGQCKLTGIFDLIMENKNERRKF